MPHDNKPIINDLDSSDTDATGNLESLGLDDEFDAEMLAAFKIEADELLEASECQLLILESDPTDATALNALFRAFHTIKGNAGFLKIDPTLGRLAHDAETVLSLCRTGGLTLEGQSFELVLESAALMRVLMQGLDSPLSSAPPADVQRHADVLRASLTAIANGNNTVEAKCTEAKATVYTLEETTLESMEEGTTPPCPAPIPETPPISEAPANAHEWSSGVSFPIGHRSRNRS